ncbi:MAG: phosphatidylglycerophosphatase family protein [Micavibrio sp.]|nr:phosphatidylglycerophosphatase family protein [Micavibrio sp.]
MRPGPGTWGTIGALPFGIIFLVLGGPLMLILAATALYYPGLKAAAHVMNVTKDPDPKMVVVDEVVGMWLALVPAALTGGSVLLAFALFRLFDILKPWPVSYFDQKMPGAKGVMLDDVAAGIMAAICLVFLRFAGIPGI